MSELSGQYQKLPPGWDCKYDQTTGNCYYINYFTKVMQLEDPRTNYKQLQNERCSTESIPLQQIHNSGGSPYHVYPSNNPPVMRAFQPHNVTALKSNFNRSTSPLLSSRTQLQELSPVPFLKNSAVAQTPQRFGGNMSRRSTIQETSFTNQAETDAVVAKIQNMFPTASENHIRLLLKRYYNREAVVISALQVEKHPVTMPGPFVTPPAQRHLFHSNSAFYMTPPARRLGGLGSTLGGNYGARSLGAPLPAGGRFGSVMSMHSGGAGGAAAGRLIEVAPSYAVGSAAVPLAAINRDFQGSPRIGDQWRSSPKPHSSPKMKLRYMKTIFPKADETLLLDVLANMDNNVQRASEQLLTLGYVKRDFVAPKPNNRPPSDETRAEHAATLIPLRPKEYNDEEKLAMQRELKEKYPQIAEKIILMALESVNYAEDRAIQILQIVQEEDAEQAAKPGVNESAVKQTKNQSHAIHSNLDECQLDGPHAGGDNILTVVLETITPNNNSNNNSNNTNSNNNDNTTRSITDLNIQKCSSTSTTTTTTSSSTSSRDTSATTTTTRTPKHIVLPSINVTTPTTATTQIILSNSPISIHNNNNSNGHVDDEENESFSNGGERETVTQNNNTTHTNTKNLKKDLTQETTTKKLTINNNYNKLKSKRNSQTSILLSTSAFGLNFATSSTFINNNSQTFTPPSSSTSASSSAASSFSTLPSSSKTFPTMTTKSILARHPNTYGIASNGLNMGNHHGYGFRSTSFSSSSSSSNSSHSASSILEKLTATRSRDKIDSLKDSQRELYNEDMPPMEQENDEFQSLLGRIKTMGHNTALAQGPDENLLLADYVTWNGANPDISMGSKQTQVSGADPTILTGRSYKPQGRNPELCKGPQAALAKGSIYAKYGANVGANANTANIKCN